MSNNKLRRREFFKLLTPHVGVPAMRYIRIEDLLVASDSRLAPLIPAIRPGVTVMPGDVTVRAALPSGETCTLFECTDSTLLIFNGFNGQNTLQRVGEMVAIGLACPESEGFAAAKSLFLHLVQLGVGVSCNSWEE